MSDRIRTWLLEHPCRASWITLELMRAWLPWRKRLSNAWWQLRHFGEHDAFHALWLTYWRSTGGEG